MHPVPSKDEYHRHTPITVEQDIPVPMRDGIRLYADVYRPSGGGRHPVLLQRLPYGKHKPRYRSFYLEPLRAVNRGYVVVLQDVRGRHASEGAFYPYRHEVDDGYDTVEWCASQPWCDGNVGMFGISYHGATQWLAATAAPPTPAISIRATSMPMRLSPARQRKRFCTTRIIPPFSRCRS